MKIVVFGAARRVGALIDEKIIDLNHGLARSLREKGDAKADEQAATRLPARLLSFIESGAAGLEEARRVIDQFAGVAPSDDRGEPKVVHNASEVRLHAPWPERRIACVGGNYAAHLAGMWANRLGKTDVSIEQITEEAKKAGQWGFWKVPAEVAGPGDTIPFPKRVTYFDYEGEVAIVIGKRGKNISAAKISEYVWGVTLFHDWSIRDGGGTDRAVSYNLQKNFDGAVSMGPCIVVGEAGPSRHRRRNARQRRRAPELQHQRDDLEVRRSARISLAGFHFRARRRDRRRHLGGHRRRQIAPQSRRQTAARSVSQSRRHRRSLVVEDRRAGK